jgi:hypothetical protein
MKVSRRKQIRTREDSVRSAVGLFKTAEKQRRHNYSKLVRYLGCKYPNLLFIAFDYRNSY